MIKANELRIGNVFRGVGGVQTVLSLEENTDRGRCNYSSDEHRSMYSHLILCHQNCNQYKPFEIDPIPLTEEILLKCGFEKAKVNTIINAYISFSFYLTIYDDKLFYEWKGGNIEVKHLHQLQNLYFALTGQELNTEGLI